MCEKHRGGKGRLFDTFDILSSDPNLPVLFGTDFCCQLFCMIDSQPWWLVKPRQRAHFPAGQSDRVSKAPGWGGGQMDT